MNNYIKNVKNIFILIIIIILFGCKSNKDSKKIKFNENYDPIKIENQNVFEENKSSTDDEIKIEPIPVDEKFGFIIKNSNLYYAPSFESEIIEEIEKKSKVEVFSMVNTSIIIGNPVYFYDIRTNTGINGYIHQDNILLFPNQEEREEYIVFFEFIDAQFEKNFESIKIYNKKINFNDFLKRNFTNYPNISIMQKSDLSENDIVNLYKYSWSPIVIGDFNYDGVKEIAICGKLDTSLNYFSNNSFILIIKHKKDGFKVDFFRELTYGDFPIVVLKKEKKENYISLLAGFEWNSGWVYYIEYDKEKNEYIISN